MSIDRFADDSGDGQPPASRLDFQPSPLSRAQKDLHPLTVHTHIIHIWSGCDTSLSRRAILSDDFAFLDRHSVNINTTLGAEEFLGLMRTTWDLLSAWRCRVMTTEHDPQLGLASTVGVDEDGNEVSWEVIGGPVVRNRKLTRLEFFDIEEYDAAVARARELENTTE